jgi:adenylate cyclase 9
LNFLALPILGTLSNFNCDVTSEKGKRELYLQLVFISLTHFSNLSALNYVVKSSLATVFAVLVMISYSSLICVHQVAQSVNSSLICVHQVAQSVIDPNVIEGGGNMTTAQEDRSNRLYSEVIVCIFTLILLVWLMNREFEISYRLSYHCSKLSQRDRRKIQTLKNQADWLLHNIIPRYVNKLSIKYYHYQRNIL